MKIPVEKKILSANDQVAEELNQYFHEKDMLVVNFMASPGAGKTSLILATLNKLSEEYHPGVIEGDLASSIDADKIKEQGTPVVQINTGGNCHLDAPMIRSALPQRPIDEMNMLFIENVGNLVCTANFSLGADLAIVVASVSEGHDKPYKYPGMFANADAEDMYAAIDLLVDKLDRQVIKHKEKVTARQHGSHSRNAHHLT